jgi:GAF domain-containing protein
VIDEVQLQDVLVKFARTLVTDYDVEQMLDDLCRDVASVLDVEGAGVMLEGDDGELHFVAASDEVLRNIEALQIELHEGPCVHAYETGEPVVVPDLETGGRFPAFAPRAVAAGMRGVYSFPMRQDDEAVGALNLYRADIRPFDERDGAVGQILADLATTYIVNARTHGETVKVTEQLRHALDSRIVIEQAKGRLAERWEMTPADAFEVLRRYARNNGHKLHEVAGAVMAGKLEIDREAG